MLPTGHAAQNQYFCLTNGGNGTLIGKKQKTICGSKVSLLQREKRINVQDDDPQLV